LDEEETFDASEVDLQLAIAPSIASSEASATDATSLVAQASLWNHSKELKDYNVYTGSAFSWATQLHNKAATLFLALLLFGAMQLAIATGGLVWTHAAQRLQARAGSIVSDLNDDLAQASVREALASRGRGLGEHTGLSLQQAKHFIWSLPAAPSESLLSAFEGGNFAVNYAAPAVTRQHEINHVISPDGAPSSLSGWVDHVLSLAAGHAAQCMDALRGLIGAPKDI